jgi:hypothetical protein
MALIQFLADHRNVFLTKFFLVASFIGDVEGYILIITLIYVIWDKQLAIRLSILVLLTMSLNHLLKIIISKRQSKTEQNRANRANQSKHMVDRWNRSQRDFAT